MRIIRFLGVAVAAVVIFMVLWGFNVINAAFFDNLNPFKQEPTFVAAPTPPGEGMPEMTLRKNMHPALLLKVADAGIAPAQLDLANDYYYGGRDIEKNVYEAANWFRRAAESGEPTAMTSLAHVIRDPIFKTKRRQKFVDWINGQALLGVPEAEFVMGRFYENGFLGFEADAGTALKWYQLAAEGGHGPAIAKLKQRELEFYRKNIQMSPGTLQKTLDGVDSPVADENSTSDKDAVTSLLPGFTISPNVMKEIEYEIQGTREKTPLERFSSKDKWTLAEAEVKIAAAGTVPSAARNDAIAMLNVMPHDQVLALADKDYAIAKNRAGVNLYNGVNGAVKDIKAARDMLWEAATAGEPDAYHNLSNTLANPDYTEQQKAAIMSWFSDESGAGNIYAQDIMGDFYLYGYLALKADKSRSFALEKSAAEQGLASAQADYGIAFMLGLGTEKDQPEGFLWLTKAANQGHADGQYWLAGAYKDGRGTAKDDAAAVMWYERALAQGRSGAAFELVMLYANQNGPVHDDAKAAGHAELMVKNTNSAVAHQYLGDFYLAGRHYPQDSAKAAAHYTLGSVGEYTGTAKYKLATLYLAGDGVPQSREKGIELLKLAANDFSFEARAKLTEMGIDYKTP